MYHAIHNYPSCCPLYCYDLVTKMLPAQLHPMYKTRERGPCVGLQKKCVHVDSLTKSFSKCEDHEDLKVITYELIA